MSQQKNVVVVGYVYSVEVKPFLTGHSAGVAGLTTALLLSKKTGFKIVVAAKHVPGDYDIEYASPWAGANYMPWVQLRFHERQVSKRQYQSLRQWNRGRRVGQEHLGSLRRPRQKSS